MIEVFKNNDGSPFQKAGIQCESQNDTAQVFVNQPSKTVFTAKEDGTFKIYMDGENCKPDFYRVVRKDSPVLSGKLILLL